MFVAEREVIADYVIDLLLFYEMKCIVSNKKHFMIKCIKHVFRILMGVDIHCSVCSCGV